MSSTRKIPAVTFFEVSFFLLATCASISAQDATGAIRGTVLDSSGSRIAQASIAIVNTATGKLYTAISDAEGSFALDLLRDSAALPAWNFALRLPARTKMSRSRQSLLWSIHSLQPSPRCWTSAP